MTEPWRCPRCESTDPKRRANGLCQRCDRRAREGNEPYYRGACLGGCGRPGRGRSGYCPGCYKSLWLRVRMFRRVAGTLLTLPAVIEALRAARLTLPIQREALGAILTLLEQVERGEILVIHRPTRGRRARTRPVTWERKEVVA